MNDLKVESRNIDNTVLSKEELKDVQFLLNYIYSNKTTYLHIKYPNILLRLYTFKVVFSFVNDRYISNIDTSVIYNRFERNADIKANNYTNTLFLPNYN